MSFFSLGMHVGKSVEKSKRSDQIDLFHTGHAALLYWTNRKPICTRNFVTYFACMHEIENTYLWLSSIYHDRSQYFFFSSMDDVIRRNILQRYNRGVSLTLLLLIRLRDHSNLHLLSVSHDACIYDIDLSTKLLSYILIPIVIGSFYLSLYKTFYNLKPSFLLGI